MGRASMSARRASAMGPSPMSQISPVPSRWTGVSPAASRRATSLSVVADSRKESSGCEWMSRRKSMSSGPISAIVEAMTLAGVAARRRRRRPSRRR